MARNTIKVPFFLDRKNESRELFALSDAKTTQPIVIGNVEFPTGTSLENLLVDSDSRPYKVYSALLTQASTAAPTAVVLENTLGGTVTLAYSSTGTYTATLTGAFTANKTPLISQVITSNTAAAPAYLYGVRTSADVYTLTTGTGSALANAKLVSTPIEIRVYY